MIRYADELFLTDRTRRDLNKIKRKLYLGAGMPEIFVIKMADGDNDVFDIVPATMFKSRRYRHMDHAVLGIAESRRKAYRLVESMILKHYEACGKYTELKSDYLQRFNT
ncbi:MAG: hypothetical protein IK111_02450 [Lachnospiraceae bacterium]|nr:hypothetical protein [Lachnospiraceae bacterium]